jgi:hypothetical protein
MARSCNISRLAAAKVNTPPAMIKVGLMLGTPASNSTSPAFSSNQISQRVAGAGAPRRVAAKSGSAPKAAWTSTPNVMKWTRSQGRPTNQGIRLKLVSTASSAMTTATTR